MHEDGFHVGDYLAAHIKRQRAARLDIREQPAGRRNEQHVLHNGKHDGRENVMIVVARNEQN